MLLAVVTGANFLFGVLLLNRAIAMGATPSLAFLVTLAATTIAGFALSRLLLRRVGPS